MTRRLPSFSTPPPIGNPSLKEGFQRTPISKYKAVMDRQKWSHSVNFFKHITTSVLCNCGTEVV
jgi:hypothetical protein